MLNVCALVVRRANVPNILVISVSLACLCRLSIPVCVVIYGVRALITPGNMVEESYFSIYFAQQL